MCPISRERSVQVKSVAIIGRRREIVINVICLTSSVSFLFGSFQCIGGQTGLTLAYSSAVSAFSTIAAHAATGILAPKSYILKTD